VNEPGFRWNGHAWRMRPTGLARVHPLAGVVACVALVTAAIFGLREVAPVLGLGSLYLLAVLPAAILWGRLYAVLAAVLGMLAFNFLFLPPVHTFQLEDRGLWVALGVYVATALVVSDLAASARRRAAEAERREREEALLAEAAIALLQGDPLDVQLERLRPGVAVALGVSGAEIELGEHPAPGTLPLVAGRRTVGAVHVFAGEPASGSDRFLAALASLVAVAADREELERAALDAERLRLSDAVKTTILRSVSHDLRSPLTAIRVAAESLEFQELQLDPADRRRQLDTVLSETMRLDRMVENLLDISRLEAGVLVPERRIVTLDEIVEAAVEQADGISVEALPEPVAIAADPVQVERALANLVENALRYGDGTVVIRVRTAGGEALIDVEDSGPGVARSDAQRIFEPFEAVAGPGGRRGSGLGLAIARGFAEANGGRLVLESPPRGGARFTLVFPLALTPEVRT
jgi:two-component system, OmpR family, sensor histidine kinase KdpD